MIYDNNRVGQEVVILFGDNNFFVSCFDPSRPPVLRAYRTCTVLVPYIERCISVDIVFSLLVMYFLVFGFCREREEE